MKTIKMNGVRVAARKISRAIIGANRMMKKMTTAARVGGMTRTTTTVHGVFATRRTITENAVAADRSEACILF